MLILSTFERLAHRYFNQLKRHHTERMLQSLPRNIQKDIGWPQPADEAIQRRPRHTVKTSASRPVRLISAKVPC
ncbi:hypothetical protein [Oryzicola mucosus]|uniref:DUF1127 domain-containing protein n=1 Tax=Oryzicola mucosus TaxID=2767425 RepID=A0A8J6PJV0_9HYPH|nr:hypothetical protein [Oryzicola mucosus]MBD0414951.1 hypothetical protein [Oryzicola mucosus]